MVKEMQETELQLEQAVYDLFDRYASTGALLVTFQGVEAVRVMRRVTG